MTKPQRKDGRRGRASASLPALLLAIGLTMMPGVARAVPFATDVMPWLTQAGCNSGACHGAAIGRGGFRLSLYGQDPAGDYERIVRELEGRRVNVTDPEASLLLRKAGEFMEHGGGLRLDPGSAGWEAVRGWIAEGCPQETTEAETITAIRVEPARLQARASGETLAVRVLARLHNGKERDLTDRSRLEPQDDQAVRRVAVGKLQVQRPGRHVVIARVRNFVAPLEVILPADATGASPDEAPRPQHFVDEPIDHRLEQLGIAAADAADDRTFLRRATLDLIGRVPTPAEVQRFVDSPRVDKRTRLIDRLLASDAAIDYWTYWLADAMRLPAVGGNRAAAASYHDWLQTRIQQGRPLPQIATALLTAEGKPSEAGEVGFYLAANDARRQAELFAEIMIGARLRCANCHDHPLDRWTQEDYHGLAAIFAGVQRTPEVRFRPGRMTIHPGTGDPAVPKLPGAATLPPAQDHRSRLARWLVESPGGRQRFARAWANRVWAALMGRGLVDPIDDHRQTNPATHPELLDALVADWETHHYDLWHLIRRIVTSHTYGRQAWETAAGERLAGAPRGLAESWYACRAARPLPTAVLLDAIRDVTGVAARGKQHDERESLVAIRAVQTLNLPGTGGEAAALGMCQLSDACEADADLQQKLALLCGPLINRRVEDPRSWIARRYAASPTDTAGLVEAIFVRFLGRPPRPREQAFWCGELDQADRQMAYQDLAWSLLNCHEFTTNH